jgi:DNA-binding NarL/FixJ family response regulator
VRQGIRELLEAEHDFEVVGEAPDGLQTLDLVRRLAPEVLVVDLLMPALSGLDVIKEVRRLSPATRVVVLSMFGDRAHVLKALAQGATAYVLKEAGATELVQAIREAKAGRRFLSPPLSEEMADADGLASGAEPLDPYETLTGREREVLLLTSEGHSRSQIAEQLQISPRTVETHRANLMRKLKLRNRAELVRYALERGLLPPGPGSPGPGRALIP